MDHPLFTPDLTPSKKLRGQQFSTPEEPVDKVESIAVTIVFRKLVRTHTKGY